jgi:hypothetical protein
MRRPAGLAPPVVVRPLACRRTPRPDRWRCTWALHNAGGEPLWLIASWLPHGRFRAPQRTYRPPRALPPGASVRLVRMVSCQGTAGEEVENAFLILRVAAADGRPWRVLARLTIRYDPAGHPHQRLERLTGQPVGFAQHRGPQEHDDADDRA